MKKEDFTLSNLMKRFMKLNFVPTEYEFLEFSADNKNSKQLKEEIIDKIDRLDSKNKIVILKVKGDLIWGEDF